MGHATLAVLGIAFALAACNAEDEATPNAAPPSSGEGAGKNPDAPNNGDLQPTTPATQQQPTIDVRQEGAKGDGVTDDSTVIAAALAKGIALGHLVVFPKGTYRVAKVVHVEIGVASGSKLSIEGRDGASIVGADAPEPTAGDIEEGILDISGPKSGEGALSELRVAHLTINVGRKERGSLDGLYVRNVSTVTLEDLSARGASRWGIAVERARKSSTIKDCRAEDNRYGGLGLNAAANVVVSGGVYSDNGTVAPVDGYGISCMSSVIGPCEDVSITGLHADHNKRKGIDVHSGHRIVIDGNSVTGFDSSGIYAVNEDPGKDVADVTITNNIVDGTGASHYVYGVEVGAFSSLATPSGTFVVRGNTIKNTSFTTSSAVMIRNPESGGAAPTKVVIEGNTIDKGAAPDAYVIRGDNYGVPVGRIEVKDNVIGAASAAVGIGLLRTTSAAVTGNTITIGAGSTAYGILVSAPSSALIQKNEIRGGAGYATAISVGPGQVLRMNTLRGVSLPDAN